MRYLSYELSADTPVFGANAPVVVEVDADFTTGPYLQHRLCTVNHNGTHVDVPSHFHEGALTLSDLPAETWAFRRPCLVDHPVADDHVLDADDVAAFVELVPEDADALLLRTGFGACRDTDPDRYLGANPGLSESAALALREQRPALRAVFCDIPSFTAASSVDDGVAWHRAALRPDADGRFLLLFEDVHLPADLETPARVVAPPLRLAGLDGAPVTILAFAADELA
jgi:arylformamidase